MMYQIPNINVPVDSLKSVMDEQRNLRQDIEANNKERCQLQKFVANLISVCETKENHSDVVAGSFGFSDASSSTCTPKTTKSVDSIQHIDLSSDEDLASMSGIGKISISDQLLQELYVANTRIDENTKVGTELQKRWSELESTVAGIKDKLDEIINELNGLKQYFKIDNLLFHNFRFPYGLSSREFVDYVVGEINNMLPKLPIPVCANHISTAHPLPTKAKKSNVVVVRFCNRYVKDMIYEARDSVGYGVSITEHLIDHIQGIVRKAESLFGRRKVYTKSTKVYVNLNGKPNRLLSKDDAHKLFVKYCERIGSNDRDYARVEPIVHPSKYQGSFNYSSSYHYSAPSFNPNYRTHHGRKPQAKFYKSKTYGKKSSNYSVYNRPYY